MRTLAVRSIPLSEATRNGWHSANVRFAKRNRNNSQIENIAVQYGYDSVLNLGDRGFFSEKVLTWNRIESVWAVMEPQALRVTMPDFLPAELDEDTGAHWHKSMGWGGVGKRFHDKFYEGCDENWYNDDTQEHIEGIEYRIITVGDRLVQASRKEPQSEGWPPIPTGFNWHWIGVDGVADNGIIPQIKQAVLLIPYWETTILGWDIIVDDIKPYVIEVNSCPGVNEATAQRIVKAMGKAIDDGRV
jgi:hypothetical protein